MTWEGGAGEGEKGMMLLNLKCKKQYKIKIEFFPGEI